MDTAETMGEGMLDFRLGLLLEWFGKKGVTRITRVTNMEITNGDKQIIEADSIVPAVPLAPNIGLVKSLEGKAPKSIPSAAATSLA